MPMLRFGKVWQAIRHFGVLFLQFRYPLEQLFQISSPQQIETPYLSLYGYPNDGPVGQKSLSQNCINFLVKKSQAQQCINPF